MVVVAGQPRLLGFGRRDSAAELDGLYRRHADEVLRYALLVVRSRADAEDVVQATWVRALRALEGGERVQKPRNWLITIAHNECRRLLAARSRRAEVELDEVPVEQAEPGRVAELRSALKQLAPRQREALVLRELEGRTYAEIAAALELSESAVETLLFRARRAVREQMEDVLGCEETCALLGRDTLTEEERRGVRAHVRACPGCATAERRARGRKSALRRLASSVGLPWFGKSLAVALTASVVGVTAGAVGNTAGARSVDVPPLQVDKAVPARPAVTPSVPERETGRRNARPSTPGRAGRSPVRPAGPTPRRAAALPRGDARDVAPGAPPATEPPATEPAATGPRATGSPATEPVGQLSPAAAPVASAAQEPPAGSPPAPVALPAAPRVTVTVQPAIPVAVAPIELPAVPSLDPSPSVAVSPALPVDLPPVDLPGVDPTPAAPAVTATLPVRAPQVPALSGIP